MAYAAGNGQWRERFAAPSGEPQIPVGGLCADSNGVGQADAHGARPQGWTPVFERPDQRAARTNGVAHSDFPQWRQRDQQPAGQLAQQQQHPEARAVRDVGQPFGAGAGRDSSSSTRTQATSESQRLVDGGLCQSAQLADSGTDFEWVLGADGKARRVKSGVRLLVDGFPNRVGLLRGFGNAIDPRPAAAFIQAYLEVKS